MQQHEFLLENGGKMRESGRAGLGKTTSPSMCFGERLKQGNIILKLTLSTNLRLRMG